jgi:hypothetical protein
MGIHARLLQAQQKITGIAKTGHNKHFDYAFFEEREVLKVAREALGDAGLVFFYSVEDVSDREVETKRGTAEWITDVRMTCTIYDSETGDALTGKAIGRAQDGQDKGINKAIVAGLKYWLLKMLMIPTEDDTERTENTVPEGNQRRSTNGRGAHVDNECHCPKCGSGMYDNRTDKQSPASPDFKCKNKECVTNGRQTAFWWPKVAEHVRSLAVTALGAGVMDAEKASALEELIKKEEAPRVFAAWKMLEVKLQGAVAGAGSAAE